MQIISISRLLFFKRCAFNRPLSNKPSGKSFKERHESPLLFSFFSATKVKATKQNEQGSAG